MSVGQDIDYYVFSFFKGLQEVLNLMSKSM